MFSYFQVSEAFFLLKMKGGWLFDLLSLLLCILCWVIYSDPDLSVELNFHLPGQFCLHLKCQVLCDKMHVWSNY